ncbi:MAG TPA: serine/threonine-protein kinase [Thermoanaerobaculia bacterium]|jgi:serine/threonine-protein kinase
MQCFRCHAELEKSFRACPHCGEPVTDFLRRYSDEPIDGKYRIVQRLGAGGMGEVYKVEHTFLGTTRVVKVIRPQIQESRDAHERFLREARAATKVQHPNVATMHDFAALPDGSHYMVWEFIDGENLAQRLRARGTLPPRLAVRIAIEALHGLEAIHRAGIIHRDVSPENLMIVHGTDAVKIIDLGVAKVSDPGDVSATRTGIFVGKMRYASPEQLGFLEEGGHIDARTDIYALAMVLFEMLTGRPPYEAKSPHEYFLLHSRETHVQHVDLPTELPGGAQLQEVLRRALARDRNQRYSSAHEFAAALEEVERTLPDPRSMPTMALPLDPDETMRVRPQTSSTPHRETVRSQAQPPAAATVRTPLPARPVAPVAPVAPAAHKRSRVPMIATAIALLLILAIGAGAVMLLRRRPPMDVAMTTTTSAAAVPLAEAQPAQSSIDVATPPITVTTATVATTTIAPPPVPVTTTTVAPPPRREEPRVEAPPPVQRQEEPAPEPVREEPVAASGETYIDGGDDEDLNDRLIERMQNELRGTTRVSIRGSGALQLAAALRAEFPNLTITDDAPVVIRFDGTLERLGRGRKRREGHGVITKNGRVIFRYQLPSEVYRVGATPIEAFVGVLGDAF